MKVAVQGASGFVGSRAAERLHLTGRAEVVPVIRGYSSLTRVARLALDWKLADALDAEALTEAFAGCDVVFHCVAGSGPLIEHSPEVTVTAAKRAGVRRVVYVSTGVTFGFDPDPATTDDSRPLVDQPWPYNRAKARAQQTILKLRTDPDVDIVSIIPTIVFGPRSESWTVLLAHDLLSGGGYLVDEGRGVCNTVYVDNLVDAMWLAANTPEARNQDFIVGDRERVTWRELYESVAQAVGIDLDGVRRVERADVLALADAAGGPTAFVRRQLRSPAVRGVVGRIPSDAKARVRRLRAAWDAPTDGGGLPDRMGFVSAEQLLVQVCDHQLPIHKAQRVLGYDPLPFSVAAERTGAWLRAFGFHRPPEKSSRHD